MELAEIDDDIAAFLVESYENLNQIERDIVDLEKASPNVEALVRIYRALHTLKGNCGFLPFPKLESLAHAGESLLSCLRTQQLALTPEITTTLLQTVDAIRQILSNIETTKHEGDQDYLRLLKTLTDLQETKPRIASSQTPLEQPSEPVELINNQLLAEIQDITASESSSIRVSVSLLDQLMNLVGELVLARNQMIGFSSQFKDTAFATTCQRLDLLTSHLQEGVMKTRLQPIGSIWQKFPRVVRDLAIAFDKQVQVEMEGVDIELDKSILEVIKDPLTHMVRNCIAHGIELPSERTACGKPTKGRLFLRAFHESGKVNIEIGDDGRGLNPKQLTQRALQLGLLNNVQAAAISESEAINLIFLPGFSTTEEVTNLSGRGVGMDIVKRNIEKINGSIEIHSQPGQGTTFKIKIPLTLTIIPALMVTSGGDHYAIPQSTLRELVRIEQQQALSNIEIFYDVPVYRLREHLVPLVYLNQVLRLQDSITHPETFSLVVVQADNYQFGLVVDTIEDIQDIVVKPLGKQLKTASPFTGATILGNGTVALIIDVVGLANQAGVTANQNQLFSSATASGMQNQMGDHQMVLLFQGPRGARMGVPAAIAFRLEEIPRSAVEKVGDQHVIQIYGRIIPLIHLATIFPENHENYLADEAFATSADQLQIVIVSPQKELNVGLVVDHILDIVEEPLTITGIPSRPGILYCTVIQGQITEILDIDAVIQIANPFLMGNRE